MKLQSSLLVFSFGIASAIAVNACGSDDEPGPPSATGGTPGTSGAGGGPPVGSGGFPASGGTNPGSGGATPGSGGTTPGSGGGGSTDACNLNFATLPANAPVSFKDDLMPIFGLHCAGDSCHTAPVNKGGLNLGPKCDFNETAKWRCVFPTAPNPTSGSAPLTQADIDAAYASLMEAAKTVNGGTVKRVNPGSPETSFVIHKASGTQDQKGHACTNQDPMAGVGPCGNGMPPLGDPLCRTGQTGGSKYTAIAQWIKNGAQKN
jgi:hypothetical protein